MSNGHIADDAGAVLPAFDARYLAERRGDMPYAFPHYETLDAWERRAEWLREHLQASLGLLPGRERHPLNPRVLDSISYDDYVMDKVAFESLPGFLCTGNLYRPHRIAGRCPGILNPHGHWQRGRLEHQPHGSIRARCVTFARMGMVAFSYDMVGYNDSLQLANHHFASRRGALWGLSSMALQTWNSLRAVDYLTELDYVDPDLLGCTGESGGGTQTFMVAALDPRLKVLAPVNMISAHFQGGCTCENTPGLRTHTDNVEIGALAAPRPMLLVSATGDWTANTPTVEYPAIRSIYRLYDAENRLASVQVDAEHNYNAESRAAVYRWFARWLLGDEELGRDAERPFLVEPDERMRVFPSAELPQNALHSEQLEHLFVANARAHLDALLPSTPHALQSLRTITTRRLTHVLDTSWPDAGTVLAEWGADSRRADWLERPISLGRAGAGERIPGTLFRPLQAKPEHSVLLVHGEGREGLYDAYGGPGETIRRLLANDWEVLAIDPFGTGTLPAGALVRNDRDWFWSTFNPPLLGLRVQDLLTAMAFLDAHGGNDTPALVGLGTAGPWVLLAAALSPTRCAVVADVQCLDDLEDDATLVGELFAPLLRAYGDLRVAAALVAPRPLLLANTHGRFPMQWPQAAYEASHSLAHLSETPEGMDPEALLWWLQDALDA
ncbi:MAG: alpha/beta hydrolase family protein [Anaerolineae bacterium]